jgi:5-formyltetrahydrofolate cyclo-ligase
MATLHPAAPSHTTPPSPAAAASASSPQPSLKHALRGRILALLRDIPPDSISERSAAAAERLARTPAWQRSRCLSVYLSMPRGELQTGLVVARAFAEGKRVLVPRIPGASLRLARPEDMEMLEAGGPEDVAGFPKNSWGIPEPPAEREGGRRRADWSSLAEEAAAGRRRVGEGEGEGEGTKADDDDGAAADAAAAPPPLDLILLPGVAFDASGARLGHGKGFYDNFIRRVRERHCQLGLPQPTLAALALDEQVLEEMGAVPMTELDERVDLVVTPTRVIEVGGRGEG